MSKNATAEKLPTSESWGPVLAPGDRRMASIRSADNSVLPIGGPNATQSTMMARKGNVDGYDVVWSMEQRHYLVTRWINGVKMPTVRIHETNAHGEEWE